MRVPLYVSLPIIVAFAAAGFVASVEQPDGTTAGASTTHGSADLSQALETTTAVEPSPRIDEKQLSAEATPPPVAAATALPPTDEAAPAARLTPIPTVPERHAQQEPQRLAKPALPPSPAKPERQQARATRPETNAARPQRTAQQRPSAPYASSAGVKSIPFFGPVLSFFQ